MHTRTLSIAQRSSVPAIVQFNGTKYAYLHNLQGDIVGIVDSSGNEVVKYIYDPWGKILSTSGSLASTLGTIQPFRYRGYVYDEETDLYYLRSRYYNPAWNRFVNEDCIFASNLFCYCSNQPINRVDPSGFESEIISLDEVFDNLRKIYKTAMDASKGRPNTLSSPMAAEEFTLHLYNAYKDEKWKYVYGNAQFRRTDCVGLYKSIMEWYYTKESFNKITKITSGKNKGSNFNQVKDMIRFGIVNGEDGIYGMCMCCGAPPVGAAVFSFKTEEEGNKNYNINNGWIHVGYYIGYGLVIEAESEKNGIIVSDVFDQKWDYWGLLKGIAY